MKKALKIIIPILLALLVLGSVIWYLLVYDPVFTRDMLLQQARYQERKGNHSLAAWFYDKAYYQSSQDDSVAIKLAEQYKAIGNYTKAEYSLSSAISHGGSTELYVALCKTYVEQDKLLDAVTMLENVSDPDIKAELEALRPAAPTADYEPGFYTKYISVALKATSGTLYVNAEGEYPSVLDPAYSGPITLPAGETTIYALAIGENGLVSELSILGYTVSGVVEKISFADSSVEAAVRSLLNVSDTKELYTNDLWTITSFEMPQDAATFEDLALLPYLESLTIHDSDLDLSPITNLTHLKTLDLSGCKPTDDILASIATFPNLQSLNLSDCELSSISELSGAVQLTYLNLENNTIRNIQPLSSMTELQELYMPHNALVSLEILSTLTKLQRLDVSYNALTSLSPVGSCSAINWLNASNNSITDTDGVNRLTGLTHLDLSFNNLADISSLAQLVKLTELNISDNSLTDISALSTLVELAVFNFANNQVTVLPAWPEESTLVTIDGSNNLVESLDPLKGFQKLNHVFMDYNKLTSIDALVDCPLLIQVNVYGNEIDDVSALTGAGVIVNYTP
ncbi:MAG: leucine-rich repeat domain-containing protein [Oscillospiraceae bacterium]|nr:leucine-rich repeat domain-containing protein [Oscillospiraceae bacterium]